MRSVVRLGTTILVNAVALGLADLLFDGFTVSPTWIVVVVLAFSIAGFFLRRLRLARVSAIPGGLALTFAALYITTLVVPGDDFEIEGWFTWVGVTVLLWAAGTAFGEVDRRAPRDAPGKTPVS